MKRTIGLMLTLAMLAAAFAVPALAYTDPSESAWPSDWRPAVGMNFSDADASPLQGLRLITDANQASPAPGEQAVTYTAGAALAENTTALDAPGAYVRSDYKAAQSNATTNHGMVSADGATIDLAVKFLSLPDLTTDILNVDGDGNYTTSGSRNLLGQQVGLVINIRSLEPYYTGRLNNAGLPYETEYMISFAKYDNPQKGTNAVIVFNTGNRGSLSSLSGCPREVYFCNLDVGETAGYHRYTFKTDYAAYRADPTNTDNTVTLYVDGVAATTFSAPMYTAPNANTGDSVNFRLYTHGRTDRAPLRVSFDQCDFYGTPLTPKDATPATFVEEAPLYTQAFLEAYNAATALTESTYSKKSWAVLAAVLAEVTPLPTLDKAHVTQAQLDDWTARINAAVDALKVNEFKTATIQKKIYIPYSYWDWNDRASYQYAWTNSAILFTNPYFSPENYWIFTNLEQTGTPMNLTYWTSIVCSPTAVPGEFTVDAVFPSRTPMYERIYNGSFCAPDGGFLLFVHLNTETEMESSTSRYASQLFADRNAEATANIVVGTTAVLSNVTINDGTAATLSTTGEWRSRYDAQMLNGTYRATSSGALCKTILEKYPVSGGTAVWRDYFQNFETASTLSVAVKGTAYLDDYNAITGKIAAARQADYTAESWAALQAAEAQVNLDLADLTQDMIDEWTDALTAAYNALVKVETPPPGGGDGDGDGDQTGTGEKTGDNAIFILLGVVSLLAVICAAALVIGRKRGSI